MRVITPLFPLLGSCLCLAAPGLVIAGDLIISDYATDAAGLGNAGAVARAQGSPAGVDSPPASQSSGLPPSHEHLGTPQRADLRTPPVVTLNLYQALDSRWALTASAGWQEWSAFRRIGIDLDANHPVPTGSDRNYRDIWRVAVGAQYRQTPDLVWQAGLGYDSAAAAERRRTFDAPLASSWRLAAGLTYAFEQDAEMNFSYAYVKLGEVPAEQRNGFTESMSTTGEFSSAGIHVMNFSITWRY